MGKQILIDEELLLELKAGILDAICSEDGLDGADGTYLLSGINLVLGLPVDDHTSPVPAQQGDETSDIERAARVVESFARYYPPNIFTPPPPGEHGKTVDSCSAAAIREILPNIAEEIRKLQST